jgi:amino acid permease
MKTAMSASVRSIHDMFRNFSKEQLSPSFDDPRRTMHSQSAIFGLVSTIVGGGVLSLPFAFAQTGLVLGTALLLGSAAASEFTIQLVVSCARRTGAESYEALALHSYGPWAQTAVVAVVAALTWMCSVAYLVLMADMLEPLVEGLPRQLAIGRRGVTLAAGAGVLPLCLLRSLHALRFTSVLCVVAVLALAGCIAYKSLTEGYAFVPPPAGSGHHHDSDLQLMVWPRSASAAWMGTLHALPIFCVSFLCHFNVVSTHTQLHAPSRDRVSAVMRRTKP